MIDEHWPFEPPRKRKRASVFWLFFLAGLL
jgi:hypothetical protein